MGVSRRALLAALAWPLAAGAGPSFERISARAWRLPAARGEPDAVNLGLTAQLVLVDDGPRLWLVGSGPSPEVARGLAEAARRAAGRAVTEVVVTRAAPELAMGNIAFEGARIWALGDVISTMKARCPTCREHLKARLGPAGASLVPEALREPFLAVDRHGETAGRLGPFDWQALARAPGERVLVLKARIDRLAIAQGLLWAGDVPDLRDTRSDVMLASLRRLRRIVGRDRVLGEQGPFAEAAAIADQERYVAALRQAVAARVARGESVPELELPAWADRPGYSLRHPLNVQRAWREAEEALFR